MFYNFTMSQTERIFYIIDQLMEKGRFRRDEVARHFEVSQKQIWRDKEYLRDRCPLPCGNLDIVYDRSVRAYVLTAEAAEHLIQWRAEASLSFAKSKQEGKQNLSESTMVASDAAYITYKSYAKEHFSPSVYDRIMNAMKNGKRIKLHYPTSKKHPIRVVEPLRLINYGEIWYLIANVSGKLLTYSLSRIEDVEIEEDDIEFSDSERLQSLLDGYGIYSDELASREYVINFYSWAIPIVAAQLWQKDQKLSLSSDGKTLELRLPISNHTELLSRILFYGDAAEPIAPDDFVSEYRIKCREMAKRYE